MLWLFMVQNYPLSGMCALFTVSLSDNLLPVRYNGVMSGIPIVTDKRFWWDDPAWLSNRGYLMNLGALIVEGVDVFTIRQSLLHEYPPFQERFPDIGLVVVGGFPPPSRQSAVVQAITHQLPEANILLLYASRDETPVVQDQNLIHVQTWTADANGGYVVRAGNDGVGGSSRCRSVEARARGVSSDPALVKVSAFVRNLNVLHMIGTCISPSATVQAMLTSSRSVLFCAEGDASLARCCMTPIMKCIRPVPCEFPLPRRFSPRWGSIETYATLQQRAAEEAIPPQDAADEWAQAWPTSISSSVEKHRFCGCQRTSHVFLRFFPYSLS